MACPAAPRPTVALRVVVFAGALVAAACPRSEAVDAGASARGTNPPPAATAAPPPASRTPTTATSTPTTHGSTLARVWLPPELREPTNATTAPDAAQLRALFLGDCHAVPWRVVDDETSTTGLARRDVCRAEGFDQNCAPDFFGCWAGRESCRAECGSGCLDCESRCGGACMDCRAACSADDEGCLEACDEARADCFDACATALDRCKDETCQEGYTRCEAGGEVDRKRVCGKVCDKLMRCLESADYDRCRARFPKADPRCFEWCQPY